MANRKIKGNQQTVTWQVGDAKVSHICAVVNEDFYKWGKFEYGNAESEHVKVTSGQVHKYLGMNLKCIVPSIITIDMRTT